MTCSPCTRCGSPRRNPERLLHVRRPGRRSTSPDRSSAQTAEARLQRLDGVNGSESRRLLGQLREQWRDAQDLDKLTRRGARQGLQRPQPVADLARRNQQLMDLGGQLYRSLQRENAATVPTLTEQSREQSLLMQDIALDMPAQRVGRRQLLRRRRRASTGRPGQPLSVQPVEALQQAPPNDEEIARRKRSVATKGGTTSGSLHLLQPEQRAVPGQQECRPDHRWPGEGRRGCMPRATNEPQAR